MLRGTGGARRLIWFGCGAVFILAAPFLAWSMDFQIREDARSLMIAAPILAGVFAFAFGLAQLGSREIRLDGSGIRFLVRGNARWAVAWRDITGLESYRFSFRHSRAGMHIITENGSFRLDTFNDFGPEDVLRQAFHDIAARTAGRSVKLMDRLGWAKGRMTGR